MSTNPKKFNRFYIDVLNSLKTYSTCSRLQVAAILVNDSRILSSGYNGVAKGCRECNKMYARSSDGKILFTNYLTKHVTSMNEAQYRKEHHEFADKYEIHAEMNCLGFALKNNTDIRGAQLYLTTSPCLNCSKLIIVSGIKEVYFLEEYDDTSGVLYLLNNGVLCEKIEE